MNNHIFNGSFGAFKLVFYILAWNIRNFGAFSLQQPWMFVLFQSCWRHKQDPDLCTYFAEIQYLMAGVGVGPGWTSGLVYLSSDAKTRRGGNACACGGQRIDVWELHGATWMAKGQEIYSLMKPTYDSLLRLPATLSKICYSDFFLFLFLSCHIAVVQLFFLHQGPLASPPHPRLHNLFLSSFSLSSLPVISSCL